MTRWNRKAFESLYGQNIASTHRSLVTPALPIKKKRTSTSGLESERKAQQRLVAWMCEAKILHFAIPNGANVSPHHRQTLVSEGLSAGCPDLCIPLARGSYHGLFIELKREDGGSGLSELQKKWIASLNHQGYYAVECRGYQRAKECVEWYLSLSDYDAGGEGTNGSSLNI